MWNTVPAFMELLVGAAESDGKPLPSCLRSVWMSGDFIPLSLPERIYRSSVNPSIRVVSMGGATEAAIWSNIYEIPRDLVPPQWTSIPYGVPLRNQTMMILDDDTMEHCEEWVTGVIYIGGLGVALGYYQDDERTAKQFVLHPRTHERLFRTGDLGRLRPGGLLEILGREDSQVKLNGFRIELGEVEAALLNLTTVQSVCASVHDKSALVAHVVPMQAMAELDKAGFVQSCRERCTAALPEYMVPKFFILLESMPLSANGKVLRNKLPPPDISPVPEASLENIVLPSTVFEKQISSCFAQALQLGHNLIDVNTSFFSMGGNSLTALHLLMILRKNVGIHLNVADFFGQATIAQLAQAAVHDKFSGEETLDARTAHGSSERLFPLQEARAGSSGGSPHFMIHGAGASGLAFRALIAALDDTARPTYAVEDASLNGSGEFSFDSIHGVADAYGELILWKLNELGASSCYLSGWSYGGVVSIEVARKLEANKIVVKMLSIFDAPIRGPASPGDTDEDYAAEEAVIRNGLKQHMGDGSTEISRLLTERAVDHWKNCISLLRAHRTKPLPKLSCGAVHFVVREGSAQEDPSYLDDVLEGQATVTAVDGLHWTMFSEDHAPSLARELSRAWSHCN